MTEHATPQQHDLDDRLQLLIEITRDLDMDFDKLAFTDSQPLHSEMQLVYMSAYASERFSSEIDQDALLRKPFSEGTITVKVRQTLDMAHS